MKKIILIVSAIFIFTLIAVANSFKDQRNEGFNATLMEKNIQALQEARHTVPSTTCYARHSYDPNNYAGVIECEGCVYYYYAVGSGHTEKHCH